MRKLFFNILLLGLPILLFLIICPLDKRQQYLGLRGDCSLQALWIYDRINQNEQPIDIAFIGSSHTMNGINDSLVEVDLGRSFKVANLGYCRLGRNLHYSFVKELIAAKDIKYLVLEVREDENHFSHLEFPYLASTKDVLTSYPFFNRQLFRDFVVHLSYKANRITNQLISSEKETQAGLYGFSPLHQVAQSDHLAQKKEKRSKPKEENAFIRKINLSFPRAYLNNIQSLCEANNVKLYYLYLPSYGTYLKEPKETEFYKRSGELINVPKEILETENYWHDDQHLNKEGARSLSLFIARFLKDEI